MDVISWDIVYFVFDKVYILTIISLAALIILENRNPVKTVSWVLILVFLPILGLILYYFLGEDRRKKKLISKKLYRRMKHMPLLKKPMHNDACDAPPCGYEQLITLLRNTDNAPVLNGNAVQIFTNATDKFVALLGDIEQATHHIHIEYYIFEDGVLARRLREALIKKAQEGVKVRFIYDAVGSWKLGNEFFRPMRVAGIEVEAFLRVTFPIFTRRVNYRNHRKIVVIDGHIGYLGGMNVADRYLDGGCFSSWKDLHIRIEGGGVQGLQSAFLLDWYYSHKGFVDSEEYFPIPQSKHNNCPMQIITSNPIGMHRPIAQGILYAISNAKKSIRIQTPYFIPSESVLQALQVAALSGVDIKIIIPSKADSWIVHQASNSFVAELLHFNIRVYTYTKGFMHSKLIVVDDALTIIGSTNMDVRSFEYNFEVNAFIYDANTAGKMVAVFEEDATNSKPVSLEEWSKRGNLRKIGESICRLSAPLL